jgi:superfamily II DNA/RNA helicase
MPPPIKKLSDRFLTSPRSIEVARPATAATSIDQRRLKVDSRRKQDTLIGLLRGEAVKTAIIFCNRKTTVRDLSSLLKRRGFAAGQIQGDMEQAERIRELGRFKSDEINILVASDVAARGLDIEGVSHVFNYDVPWHPDDYVHRIGRTGRAGRSGVAITLVASADAEAIANIEQLIGMAIPPIDGTAAEASDEADEAAPAPRAGRRRGGGRSRATAEKKPAAAEKPAPRADKPAAKAEKPPRPAPAPRAAPARDEADGDDDGWNGPVPSFLERGLS